MSPDQLTIAKAMFLESDWVMIHPRLDLKAPPPNFPPYDLKWPLAHSTWSSARHFTDKEEVQNSEAVKNVDAGQSAQVPIPLCPFLPAGLWTSYLTDLSRRQFHPLWNI